MRMPSNYPNPKGAPPIVSKLKREFRDRFVREMKMPAGMNKRNSIVFWLDPSGYLNRAVLYPLMYPDPSDPRCPLILRITINYYAFDHIESTIRRMGWEPLVENADKECPKWIFELSLLPNELFDFIPWVVSLADAHAASAEDLVAEPPHPCFFGGEDVLGRRYGWTHAAWRANDLYRYPEQTRKGAPRRPYFTGSGS